MIGYLLLIHVGVDKPNSIWLPVTIALNPELPEEADKQGTFFYLNGHRLPSELEYEMNLFIKNNSKYSNSELKWQRVEISSLPWGN